MKPHRKSKEHGTVLKMKESLRSSEFKYLNTTHVDDENGISCLAYDKITKEIYYGNYNGSINILNKNTSFKLKNEKNSGLLVLPDGNLISHGKNQFVIWKNQKPILNFLPNKGWVRSVTTFRNGSIILTAGNESDGIKTFHIKELYKNNIEPISTLSLTNTWIYSISNIKDEYYGYSMGTHVYYIRKLNNDKLVREYSQSSFKTNLCYVYSEKLNYLILGNYDGKLFIFDVSSDEPDDWEIIKCVELQKSIPSMILLPEDRLAASHYAGDISIVNLVTFEIITELQLNDKKSDTDDLILVEDKYIYSCTDDGNIHIWKIPDIIPKSILEQLSKKKTFDINFSFK
eukprot:gene7328-11647_t